MAAEAVQVQRRLITVEEYEQIVRAGVFHEDDRLELIEGELVQMSPIGAAHAGFVARLNRLLARRVADQAVVFVQNPIRLARSEPQPDITLLRPRGDDYIGSLPESGDVLLVVEVAETSGEYDRTIKLPMYARAGIPEAWLLDLTRRVIEVHRQPSEAGYGEKHTHAAGERLSVLELPEVELSLGEVFGEG